MRSGKIKINMVRLPPYYPELNPTEFVFGHLVHELRKKWVRSGIEEENDFLDMVSCQMDEINFKTVLQQYRHCGYLRMQY